MSITPETMALRPYAKPEEIRKQPMAVISDNGDYMQTIFKNKLLTWYLVVIQYFIIIKKRVKY